MNSNKHRVVDYGLIRRIDYANWLLYEYSMFLSKNGYMDTDWRDEEPFAIDEFMNSKDIKEKIRNNSFLG